MTDHSTGWSDDDILSRLLTRRRVVRVGAATVATLAGAPALLGASDGGVASVAQTAAGTPGAEEGSIYRPTTPVGSPAPAPSGQEATPVGPQPGQASPVPGVPIASFMDLSQALVGGGTLDPARGGQLLALIADGSARRTALDELLAIRLGGLAATPVATPVALLSDGARDLVGQILRFWYLGTYGDQPVTDRADFWFSLSSWQAVEYTFATSICKAYGGWAQPPPGRS